jgi:hypothetical protein
MEVVTMQLHARATWSAREDRKITLLWLGLFLAMILVGFGFDFTNYLHETPAVPKVVHVHAAITTIWLLILTTQVLLVEVNNVKLHRKLGWFAAGWAALTTFFAVWGELSYEAIHLHMPGFTPAIIVVFMGELVCFSVLLTWGILLRKNVAAHRRIIVLANLSIAVAGFARILDLFLDRPKSPLATYFFYFSGTLFIVLLMLLWDWKKNRVMKQFVIGTVFLVAVQVVSIVMFYNPVWQAFAERLIEAWHKANL